MTVSLTKDTTPATVEVSPEILPGELVFGLNAVIPHASTDSTLPMLNAVQFSAADGRLTIAATDRYAVGTYSTEWKGEDFDVLMSLKDAKDLLRYVKGLAKHLPARLTIEGHHLTVDQFGARLTIGLMDQEFVKWRGILASAEEAAKTSDGVTTIGLNPVLLAKFAKAQERGIPMRLTFSTPLKPVIVRVGEDFVGLIMPVRLPDQD